MKCKDFTVGDSINSQLVDLQFRIVRIYVSVDMLTPLLTQLRSLPVVNHVRRVCVSVSDRFDIKSKSWLLNCCSLPRRGRQWRQRGRAATTRR